MTKLIDLEPEFLRHAIEIADKYLGRTLPDGSIQWGGFETSIFHLHETLAGADGIHFLCPLCFAKNNGSVGTHSVSVYFEGSSVPDNIGTNKDGQKVRWSVTGNDFNDLSTSPSILLQGGCGWHGFITNGEVSIL